MGNHILGHQGLVPVLGAHGGDLHSHVLADLGDIGVALHSQVHQNTVGTAGVDISNGNILVEPGEPTDLQVLTDGHDLLGENPGDGQGGAGVGAVHQGVHIRGSVLHNHGGKILHESAEGSGVGAEVGLAVDLHNGAHAALGADGGVSHALGGNAVSLLGGLGQTLFPEPVNSLVHVAVGSLEGLLAVHHADVGHFTELLNILCGKSHFRILLKSGIIQPARPRQREPRQQRPHPDGPRWRRSP